MGDDDNLSTEDRIKWLRERGIQVHIPGEEVSSSADELKFESIVVKIPQDERLPYEELVLNLVLGKAGDQYLEALKPFFKTDKNSLEGLDEDVLSKAMKDLGQNLTVKSSTILNQISEGSVEAFTLAHACEDNKFNKVSFYLDEASTLKRLPLNKRASSLASICGFENVPIHGDVFLGRVCMINEGRGPIRNVGFHLFEVDSGAEWMKNAHKSNYEHGIKTNMVSMDGEKSTANTAADGQIIAAIDKNGQNYKWSQTDDSIEIIVTLPIYTDTTALTSKHLTVKITSTQVTVLIKSTSTELLNLTLSKSINASESTWLMAKNDLELTLAKREEGVSWTNLVTS